MPLIQAPQNNRILLLVTIRQNRVPAKLLETEKEFKKTCRGFCSGKVDIDYNTALIKWQDNSSVQLASTSVNS